MANCAEPIGEFQAEYYWRRFYPAKLYRPALIEWSIDREQPMREKFIVSLLKDKYSQWSTARAAFMRQQANEWNTFGPCARTRASATVGVTASTKHEDISQTVERLGKTRIRKLEHELKHNRTHTYAIRINENDDLEIIFVSKKYRVITGEGQQSQQHNQCWHWICIDVIRFTAMIIWNDVD